MSRRAESIGDYLYGALLGGLLVYWDRPSGWWVIPVYVAAAGLLLAGIEAWRARRRNRRRHPITNWRCYDCGLIVELTAFTVEDAHQVLVRLSESHFGHRVVMNLPEEVA